MAGRETKYSVAIVDDDPVDRHAMGLLVEHIGGFRVSGSFASGAQALEAVVDDPPDLLLVELRLPGYSGLEYVEQLLQRCPASRIVVVTASADPAALHAALDLGLHGYLLKPVALDCLRIALFAVLAGHFIAPKQMQRVPLRPTGTQQPLPRAKRLSERDRQILQYLARGRKNESIASELKLRPCTVDTYVRRLFQKFAVHSRAEAITAARIAGVDPSAWSNARNRRQD
jgi:DNA-binding NarL/FixJ family response regulator